MSVESEYRRFRALGHDIGKRALNALFPDDFELYIIALELVNSADETEDYFIFPINPNSISEPKNPIQTIRKTAGGVSVMSTDTFNPTTISMQGNFGRQLKFLAGKELISFSSIGFKPSLNNAKPNFSENFKTGYGCLKVLESIVNKSNTLDRFGKPYALFFYNLALGNNYLVKAIDFTPSMNMDTNMVWGYSLTLKSLIKIEDIVTKDKRSLIAGLSATSAIQNRVNNIGNSLKALLPL